MDFTNTFLQDEFSSYNSALKLCVCLLLLVTCLFGHFSVVCNNQQLTARRGEIVTPEFPRSYPKNSRCDWTIEVDKGYQITLTFTQVHMYNK